MREFLIELYASRSDVAAVDRDAQRARLAAAELTSEGRPVRYVRSIFVPEDETCFLLYEAAAAEDVDEAARRASLACERSAVAVVHAAGSPSAPST